MFDSEHIVLVNIPCSHLRSFRSQIAWALLIPVWRGGWETLLHGGWTYIWFISSIRDYYWDALWMVHPIYVTSSNSSVSLRVLARADTRHTPHGNRKSVCLSDLQRGATIEWITFSRGVECSCESKSRISGCTKVAFLTARKIKFLLDLN